MRVLVTGSEGFIGQNLCARLEANGIDVTRWDVALNAEAMDLTKPQGLRYALTACDAVVHLAANADVRGGWSHPDKDLRVNVLGTVNLLAAMHATGCKRLVFASSAAVYGDAPLPTRESWSAQATSLYGASKVAAEQFIGAYAHAGHISADVLRFVALLGPGYAHGHVVDFTRQLRADPRQLAILGDGKTARSYVDVEDACAAILTVLADEPGFEVWNVGTPETITATESARLISEHLGVDPEVTVTGESWHGDHPILLDCSKLERVGWEPRYTIEESLARTVEFLCA